MSASLCDVCHIKAEQTTITCEEIRKAAGIQTIVLPEHFYDDERYDKWGNIFLANSQRIRGELFHDESVQKILREGGVLNNFTKHVKYARTYHLPMSQNISDDDKITKNYPDMSLIFILQFLFCF